MVYRLVTANTFDQRIVERAANKRQLEKMVIHKGGREGGKKRGREGRQEGGRIGLISLWYIQMYILLLLLFLLLLLLFLFLFLPPLPLPYPPPPPLQPLHTGKFKGYSSEDQQLSLEDLVDLLHSVDHDRVVRTSDAVISDTALKALLDRTYTPSNSCKGGGGGGEREGEGEHYGVFKVLTESDSDHGNILKTIDGHAENSHSTEPSTTEQ